MPPPYKGATCRGAYALGTACGHCEKCRDEAQARLDSGAPSTLRPTEIPGGPALVKQIVGELAAMEYAGDVKAVAIAIVDKDGDLRTMSAFGEGYKLPLIACSSILQHQLIADARPFTKDRTGR